LGSNCNSCDLNSRGINGEYSDPDAPAATNLDPLQVSILLYFPPWERIVNTGVPSRRYDSVQQDWRAILPDDKASLFIVHTSELENAYMMFSVSLNEAIALRKKGESTRACQEIGVVGELCSRLVVRINAVIHTMRQHCRRLGLVPNQAPLEAANFHSERGQRGARHSNMLSRVLLSERSQFLNKLNTLEEIVDELGDEFVEFTMALAAGVALEPSHLWKTLDSDHFDLNTCLRETDVLFKSFLLVLPEGQLDTFDFTVRGLARARRPAPICGIYLNPR
jgi:hypothetical protein